MLHIFKYKIIYMLHDKSGLIWMILFPFLMSLFFYLAFGGISNDSAIDDEDYVKCSVALVNKEADDEYFAEVAEKSGLFDLVELTKDEAVQQLAEGKITAFYDLSDGVKLTVANSGLQENIAKLFSDMYIQKQSTVDNILSENPQAFTEELMESIKSETGFTKSHNTQDKGNIVIYFYSLLAMMSIMGSTLATTDIEHIQANQSPFAARVCVAPTHKLKAFTASISATILFHFVFTALTCLFMKFVLGVDFGDNILPICGLCFAGSFCGIMTGSFISALIRQKDGMKLALLIGGSIFSSFLAGMMSIRVKYFIQLNCPIVSWLNPASLMTDGMYSLYYYGLSERCFIRAGVLLAIGAVATIGTYLVLRRQRYASI